MPRDILIGHQLENLATFADVVMDGNLTTGSAALPEPLKVAGVRTGSGMEHHHSNPIRSARFEVIAGHTTHSI